MPSDDGSHNTQLGQIKFDVPSYASLAITAPDAESIMPASKAALKPFVVMFFIDCYSLVDKPMGITA